METSLLLSTARIVLPDRVLERGWLLVEGDRIAGVYAERPASIAGSTVDYDLTGLTLFPGFIDMHIHGAVGVDTMAATAEELARVSEFLATQGVTAWLPTLVPGPSEQYARSIGSIAELMNTQREHWDRGRPARPAPSGPTGQGFLKVRSGGDSLRAGRPRSQQEQARVLGVHYEGPFVNSDQCGALHRDYFRTFSSGVELGDLATITAPGAIHMMTMAPEIDGGIELVRELSRRGWIVSIGHTRADVELLDCACEAGARHLTHFMNAMPPLHQRAPGPVGWGLLRDDVTCDLIADGIHLDRMTLRLLQRLKTPARLSLISDAIAATGLGDGDYEIWGETISVSAGRTQNSHGSIAGSVITMLDAVRLMRSLGTSEVEVALMASTNPARLLRIDNECGSIEARKRADLVGLDQDGNVRFTMVGGEVFGTRS